MSNYFLKDTKIKIKTPRPRESDNVIARIEKQRKDQEFLKIRISQKSGDISGAPNIFNLQCLFFTASLHVEVAHQNFCHLRKMY